MSYLCEIYERSVRLYPGRAGGWGGRSLQISIDTYLRRSSFYRILSFSSLSLPFLSKHGVSDRYQRKCKCLKRFLCDWIAKVGTQQSVCDFSLSNPSSIFCFVASPCCRKPQITRLATFASLAAAENRDHRPSISYIYIRMDSMTHVDEDGACVNCGKHGSETAKLKNCTCRLVKYCSVDCQKAHRKQHKKACKQRAAELQDEQLYCQGQERPEGDFCPICTLPISLPMVEHSTFNSCCMKKICNGCTFVAGVRGMHDCPFCRTPHPDNDADALIARVQERVKKKDPDAIDNLGEDYFHGRLGLQKDVQKAVELWTEAAELGSIKALYNLGNAYYYEGGIQYDKEKATKFYRKAATQGHVQSRHILGCFEGQKGNHDRAWRHYVISAKMGYNHSIDSIKGMFMAGRASKEQYAEALKGYQDAAEEMKSPEREICSSSTHKRSSEEKKLEPRRGWAQDAVADLSMCSDAVDGK